MNTDKATALEALYTEMAANHVAALWRVTRAGPNVRPYLWRWATMRRLVTEAGRLVDVDHPGERRAVALVNPGLEGSIAATHTLYAAIQLIQSGEVARAHRHTPSALRFIIQGDRASTTVEGERIPMHEGDLVLTPNWLWHEHRNEGDEDVIWMDGLDSPLVFSLAAAVYEPYQGDVLPETKPLDYSRRTHALGAVRPIAGAAAARSRLLVYRWPEVQEALAGLDELGTADPFDGVAIEYVGPGAGHALTTIACCMQMIRPGERMQAHRHTHSSVYHVFRGRGYTVIDGQRFNWAQGDSFVVPPWSWHEHANDSADESAYMFSMNDLPVLESLDLHREESYREYGGHQPVVASFDPASALVRSGHGA